VDPAPDRIDFISAYCDRWCERCAFTSRCSAYAVRMAEGMCGDFREALELALGVALPAADDDSQSAVASWMAQENQEDEADEEADADWRRREARREQARAAPIAELASACSAVAWRWLESRQAEALTADPVLKEAFEIAAWDAHFIEAKLVRALQGQVDFEAGEGFVDDPVQNDWNGSAKVALISIERSEHAWRTVADATGGETPRAMATQLGDLLRLVEIEFPKARQFVRPGFDEPGR
jgi:hypothetical protein